jgi:hypothetical protein
MYSLIATRFAISFLLKMVRKVLIGFVPLLMTLALKSSLNQPESELS